MFHHSFVSSVFFNWGDTFEQRKAGRCTPVGRLWCKMREKAFRMDGISAVLPAVVTGEKGNLNYTRRQKQNKTKKFPRLRRPQINKCRAGGMRLLVLEPISFA
jgi:hypothetical protein